MSHDCHACAVVLVKNGSSTIDNRDTSLLSMVPRQVAVLLVLLWAFLQLCRTHGARESPGKEGSCIDGAVPHHSIELTLDISFAPTRLQGPLLPRSSSQKTFSYACAINGEC